MREPPPRTYKPARTPLRAWRETAFFALLTLVALVNAAIRGEAKLLQPLLATGPLMLAGWWINMRYRTGRPSLTIDAEGLVYRRSGRERRLSWSNLERIEMNALPFNVLRLVPKDGSAPIPIDWNMVAADGDRFDMRVDDYWKPRQPPQRV